MDDEPLRRMEQLGLPPACMSLIQKPQGLLLVTGPAGSGKSTSIASMARCRAMQKNPDVVLMGELGDLPTIEAAINAAETGLVVVGTLHTTGAQRTVSDIIDVFSNTQQDQIRTRLSNSLIGVLSQILLPKIGGGCVAAYELLVCSPAIGNLIREGKASRITAAIRTGAKSGNVLFDDSLFQLWKDQKCAKADVLAEAQSAEELAARIAEAESSGSR